MPLNKSNESIQESSADSMIVMTGKRYETNPVSTSVNQSMKESAKAVAHASATHENTEITSTLRNSIQPKASD